MNHAVNPKIAEWIRSEAHNLLAPPPLALAIFGSFARGDQGPDSDLDILLVCDEIGRSPSLRSKWFFPLSKKLREQTQFPELPKAISPLILSSQGWQDALHLQLSLCTEACVLLDSGLLSSTFASAQELIRKGEWKRVPTPDHGFFWIPKDKIA